MIPVAHHTAVWIARLQPWQRWQHLLTPEDLQEANRYAAKSAHRRFLLARARVRLILGASTGIAPAALKFRRGRYGKPHLDVARGRKLHFNISHSRDTLLIAISRSGPVGIDVEHMRPIDADWLARCWFSRRERRALERVPEGQRREAFFHTWCRKEAFIKAVGLGLAMPLDRFSVSVDPARAELLELNRRRPHQWRLTRIDAGERCAAALVTFGDAGVIDIEELS